MQISFILIVLIAIIMGFAYVNGFHDGCNPVATIIASRAMSPKKALVVAAIVDLIAPFAIFLVGSKVADTIKNIVNEDAYLNAASHNISVSFIAAGIVAAIAWNVVTWAFRIPSSSSHALIGGFIGAALAAFGPSQIHWDNFLIKVVLMLFLTPVVGYFVGYVIMRIIKLLSHSASPAVNTFFKLAQPFFMVFLAANHSFNDTQKSMGLIILLLPIMGYPATTSLWIVLLPAAALSLGILFGGFRIIKTVGTGIYKVKPVHSFASQITAGSVILVSSMIGAPVSASQIVASSIMGVGSAEKFKDVRWTTASKILSTWIFTMPVVAIFGALFYYLFRLLFNTLI